MCQGYFAGFASRGREEILAEETIPGVSLCLVIYTHRIDMQDRLASMLTWFELRARVFQTGPLCHSSSFDARSGLSYIHVMRGGAMRVETAGRRPVLVERPSLVFYMTPLTHRLVPSDDGAETVCASFEFGAGLRNPLVEALPDVVLLALAETPALAATLEILFKEASEQHCGRQAVLDRLSEVIIIQLLRDLMDRGRLQSGLLAGLADPRLAKAINAMHAQPSHPWRLVKKLMQPPGDSISEGHPSVRSRRLRHRYDS